METLEVIMELIAGTTGLLIVLGLAVIVFGLLVFLAIAIGKMIASMKLPKKDDEQKNKEFLTRMDKMMKVG